LDASKPHLTLDETPLPAATVIKALFLTRISCMPVAVLLQLYGRLDRLIVVGLLRCMCHQK
jgi:hypothetical protein